MSFQSYSLESFAARFRRNPSRTPSKWRRQVILPQGDEQWQDSEFLFQNTTEPVNAMQKAPEKDFRTHLPEESALTDAFS